MNDVDRSGAEPLTDMNPQTSASTAATSPGLMLRGVREAAGVSVEALAGAMKVPVNKIEGLESDNYAALPDVVFARALAASICRVFGTSPAQVLALMPKGGAHSLSNAGADINASFTDGSERPRRNSLVIHATRPLGVVVVVLLLGAAVFVFLPYRSDAPESSDPDASIVTYEPGAIQDMPLEMALPAEPLSGSSGHAAEAGTAVPQTPAQQALAEAQTVKLEVAAVAKPESDGVLEFSARGPSWIQVRDANNKVVFERTLAKGEVASATGASPLKVVVGRADAVDVKVRGTQFDLAGVAKSNVARFEVQ